MGASSEQNESDVWRAAYAVFEAALDLTGDERAGFVTRSTASDPEMRRIVEDLLGDAELEPPEPALSGRRFGRYEVLERLGAGATGQVYAGRDTELGRRVALKFLAGGAAPPDRLIAEAKAASALNHPNIVTVYEVVRQDRAIALAMELVDGAPLRQFCGAAQPVERVAEWGRQVAAALAATHAQGMVHRDIKPENLMVRSDGLVKILDFGLARSAPPGEGSLTGALAGTLRYMAPEQVRGLAPGAASDVFALGVVLAELLGGRHPFDAPSPIEAASAIAQDEPALPAAVRGTALGGLLRRMLAKDPERRPTAADVAERLVLAARARRRVGWWVAVPVLAAFGWAAVHFRPADGVPGAAAEIHLAPPAGRQFLARGNMFALAPDGRSLVVRVSRRGAESRLALRRFDANDYEELPGTEGGASPFWAPDGGSFGFYGPAGLSIYSLAARQARTVVAIALPTASEGGLWPERDTLIYMLSGPSAGLYSVRADGSGRRLLFRSPEGPGVEFLFPRSLHGRKLLAASVRADRRLGYLDLDSGVYEPVLAGARGGTLLRSGHLVYFRDGQLFATRVGTDLRPTGRAPVAVVPDVADAGWEGGYYSISPGGTLAYLRQPKPLPTELVWVDARGRETPLALPPAAYEPLSVSPDGTRVAIARYETPERWTLFVHDLRSRRWLELTEGSIRRANAVWSADSRWVAYGSLQGGSPLMNLYVLDVTDAFARGLTSGEGAARRLTNEPVYGQVPQDWSRHGGWIVYGQGTHPKTGADLYAVRMEDPAQPVAAAVGTGFQSQPAVSPDGRWLAYRDCSASCSVVVRPFPGGGGPVTVIAGPDAQGPVWGPGGLYFVKDGWMRVVPFATEAGRAAGPSRALFRMAPYEVRFDYWARPWAMAPDGRFLFARRGGDPPPQMIRVIPGWAQTLERLVP